MNQGEPIPDKTVIELLNDRLKSDDCITNGWILRGFPTSHEGLALLKQIVPLESILVLSMFWKDDTIYDKALYRRFDPVTKLTCDLRDIKDPQVLQRLTTRPKDRKAYVKKELAEFRAFRDYMLDPEKKLFTKVCKVSGDQTQHKLQLAFAKALEMCLNAEMTATPPKSA